MLRGLPHRSCSYCCLNPIFYAVICNLSTLGSRCNFAVLLHHCIKEQTVFNRRNGILNFISPFVTSFSFTLRERIFCLFSYNYNHYRAALASANSCHWVLAFASSVCSPTTEVIIITHQLIISEDTEPSRYPTALQHKWQPLWWSLYCGRKELIERSFSRRHTIGYNVWSYFATKQYFIVSII